MRVLYAHLQDEPPDPCSLRELPPEFARAMHSALAKEPADRPSSTTEYARILAAAAPG
jgi:hypothetical protein